MNYPYDTTLDADTLVFLAALRHNRTSKPLQRILDLIEDDQPDDLKALLHTYAHHSHTGAVGDYWFEQASCRPVNDIPQIEDLSDKQLNGFKRGHGIVYANNAGGEFFLVAMWEPGEKSFRTAQAYGAGYDDDGYLAMEGNIIQVLRELMYDWSEKDLDVDFDWEDTDQEINEEILEEFTGGDRELFDVLWKPMDDE